MENKKSATVLVAKIEGVTPDNREYTSTFQMGTASTLANNKEFWRTQVDDFVSAAERGPAKLLLSTDPMETWSSKSPTITSHSPTQSINKPTTQTQTGPKKMTDNIVPPTTSNVIRSGAVKSEAFKILSGAPVPTPARGRRKQPVSDVYPFKDMAVGDMFTVAGKVNIQKARNSAQQFSREHGPAWKFITRDLSNTRTQAGGVYPAETYGIWRVVPQVQVHTPNPTAEITGDQDEPHYNSNATSPTDDAVMNEIAVARTTTAERS